MDRKSIFSQLVRLGTLCGMLNIEFVIEEDIDTWIRVLDYEEKNPQEPKIQTIEQANKMFNTFNGLPSNKLHRKTSLIIFIYNKIITR